MADPVVDEQLMLLSKSVSNKCHFEPKARNLFGLEWLILEGFLFAL
jgi:hypothetical protein